MPRSSSAAVTYETEEEDFDVPSQIAILRRAVAEIEIGRDSSATGLTSALRELTRIAVLAEATVSSIALGDFSEADESLSDACSVALFGVQDAQRLLERLRSPRPSRARLEAIRRKLHAALAALGEAFASDAAEERPETDLDRALYMRNLLSDFYAAIPWESSAPTSRTWAILVANAELRILLKHISFPGAFEGPRNELAALGDRIAGWQAKKRGSSTSKLYTELVGVSSLLSSLSSRPEVKRHDARALIELSALLAHRNFDDRMTERAVDVLATLRGMDAVLDRLIIALPLDARGVLLLVLRRVTELRARSLAS